MCLPGQQSLKNISINISVVKLADKEMNLDVALSSFIYISLMVI